MNKNLAEQSDWDELLDFITDRQLTPVIGKEMYQFRDNDKLVPIDQFLSKSLLDLNNVKDQPPLTLAEAVNYLVIEKRIKTMDIIRKLKTVVKDINFEFPVLSDFLSITELNYYINTAVYNNVLENLLTRVRKQSAESINFSITEPISDCADLEKLTAPFIFNVFGSLLNTVDPALSEEDMLEFTGSFKERMNNAPNIINALKNKNLLFLGCTFPNWIVRFVLRLLSNEPMHAWGSKRTIIFVNDQSEFRDIQNGFLKNYDVITCDLNTSDFVKELSNQWRKRNPQAIKNKMVFLSYTIKDKEAVETMKKAIEGISNVTCWYDSREIIPGDDFKTEIAKNIKSADLFIPLISENSLVHKDGYVQIEWITADNVNTFRKIDGSTEKYLMPVVIDDTNPYDNNVPGYFSVLSIGKVPHGNPDQDFINQLKTTLHLT